MPKLTGPSIKRGSSTQDYATPISFVKAVEQKFGKLQIDLAADSKNSRCEEYVSADIDSLSLDWVKEFGKYRCWLNPPFGHVTPWAKKCADFARRVKDKKLPGEILFLTPSSTGAHWFQDNLWVFGQIYFLGMPRLKFGNATGPYPKDCCLTKFSKNAFNGMHEIWKWKEQE